MGDSLDCVWLFQPYPVKTGAYSGNLNPVRFLPKESRQCSLHQTTPPPWSSVRCYKVHSFSPYNTAEAVWSCWFDSPTQTTPNRRVSKNRNKDKRKHRPRKRWVLSLVGVFCRGAESQKMRLGPYSDGKGFSSEAMPPPHWIYSKLCRVSSASE